MNSEKFLSVKLVGASRYKSQISNLIREGTQAMMFSMPETASMTEDSDFPYGSRYRVCVPRSTIASSNLMMSDLQTIGYAPPILAQFVGHLDFNTSEYIPCEVEWVRVGEENKVGVGIKVSLDHLTQDLPESYVAWSFRVAGVTHEGRQEIIVAMWTYQAANQEPPGIYLVAEPNNPHDSHAVKVMCGQEAHIQVGYVPRKDALDMYNTIRDGMVARARVEQIFCREHPKDFSHGVQVIVEAIDPHDPYWPVECREGFYPIWR